MIRPININLNAAHPELPLVEATTFTGAPSSVFIRGVPKAVGNWSITAVSVAVTYPDNTTTARAAVESAEGVWVATIPGTATSGRTVAGFRILADGIDENGAAVTGYVLGFADFSVLSFTPVPAPGGTFWLLRYFDTMPTTPKKGDVAIVDGILKYYNGAAWLPFADLTNYYTKAETDNAIERVAAYYITYTAAGAAFPTRADLLNAQTYYSGGVVRVPTRNDYAVVLADEAHGGAEYRYIYAVADGATTGQWEAQYPIETNDYTALSNKPQINGNTLTGNKTGADLGVLDLNGGTMTGEIIFGNPGEYRVKYSEGYITVVANEVEYIIAIPTRAGTMALINNIAPAFSASNTYPVGSLVSYTPEDEEKLYRCTTAVTTAGAWTGSINWTEATVEDVLAALRTEVAGKANASDLLAKLDSTSAAPAFSSDSSVSYAVGSHVTYNGKLYGCTTATTGGTWDSSCWDLAILPKLPAAITPGNLASFGYGSVLTDSNIPKTNVALKGNIPYTLVTKTISNNAVTLDNRASNSVTISTTLSPNTLTINFPTAPTGKLRDFAMRLNIAAGVTAPEIAWPQGVTLENDRGEVPEIADGGTGGSSTILYFSETENNGTTAKFLVKGETLTAIAQV